MRMNDFMQDGDRMFRKQRLTLGVASWTDWWLMVHGSQCSFHTSSYCHLPLSLESWLKCIFSMTLCSGFARGAALYTFFTGAAQRQARRGLACQRRRHRHSYITPWGLLRLFLSTLFLTEGKECANNLNTRRTMPADSCQTMALTFSETTRQAEKVYLFDS